MVTGGAGVGGGGIEGVIMWGGDVAQRSRMTAGIFHVAIHVSDGLGDVMTVVTYRELWSMSWLTLESGGEVA